MSLDRLWLHIYITPVTSFLFLHLAKWTSLRSTIEKFKGVRSGDLEGHRMGPSRTTRDGVPLILRLPFGSIWARHSMEMYTLRLSHSIMASEKFNVRSTLNVAKLQWRTEQSCQTQNLENLYLKTRNVGHRTVNLHLPKY